MSYIDEDVMSDEDAEVLFQHIMEQEYVSVNTEKDCVDLSDLQEGVDMVLNNPSFVDVFRVLI